MGSTPIRVAITLIGRNMENEGYEDQPHRKSGKRKTCKHGKPHEFVLHETRRYTWTDWVFLEYRCSVCGKKKIEEGNP